MEIQNTGIKTNPRTNLMSNSEKIPATLWDSKYTFLKIKKLAQLSSAVR